MANKLWTKDELKILREAWIKGMTAKGISSTILTHRTPNSIHITMRKNGMSLISDRKGSLVVSISMQREMIDCLKSLASEGGVSVSKLCRDIIQRGVSKENVRTGSYSKEYKRDWMRRKRAQKRQENSTKQESI